MLVVDPPASSPRSDLAADLTRHDLTRDDLTRDDVILDDRQAVIVAEQRDRGDLLRRVWSATWPKLAAIVLALGIWQAVVWSGWKPEYVLPGPPAVFARLGELIGDGRVLDAVRTTMGRALAGFALALLVGVLVGGVVASSRIARSAIGSLITGLQTMPSIAWFPLAILLFQLSEGAILFVVVLGAAPSVANGLISGVDHVPPILLRAGTMMGARRWSRFRHVVLPASMPAFVGGLKQGWAFAWRSLMAGELLVTIGVFSVGYLLQQYRTVTDTEGLIAIMFVILVIGILVDVLVFGTLDKAVRRRYGLVEGR
ncbi:MAG: ABC transporter permease [Ilumatobacteraceae bacterium]